MIANKGRYRFKTRKKRTFFQVRKKEMLRLMAKRKRSEVKVISSSDKELKTKRTRMVDEQERLDQLERRLESKVISSQLLCVVGV